MSDCDSKQYENILIQACKTNKHTSSKLSHDSMHRSALETEYKKELDKNLPEILGSSKQNAGTILQIDSTEEYNEESQGAVIKISNDSENNGLQSIDVGAVATKALNFHNNIVTKLQSLKVITTFTTDPQADLGEVLDSFIRSLDESSGVTEDVKAALLAQDPTDVDDVDYAITQKLKDITWETGVPLNQLPNLLFAPKSQEMKQIDAPQMNNLLGFEPSNNLLTENLVLPGVDNTTVEVTP